MAAPRLASPVNAGLFRNRVLQMVEGAKQNIDTATSLAVAELMRRVILRTPYGQPEYWANGYGKWAVANGYKAGALRANWNLTVDKPDYTFNPNKVDAKAETTIARNAKAAFTQGNSYWLINSAPYAGKIEYTSYSTQAPAGFLRVSLAEWQQIVELSCARVRVGGSGNIKAQATLL